MSNESTQLLPSEIAPDNKSEGREALLKANLIARASAWPAPFDQTTHRLKLGDSRDLSWISSESVHLVVTSPPYWTLKDYEHSTGQLGDVEDYEHFLSLLLDVWRECSRVLAPGGRICCVVGDVCVRRRDAGRHFCMPLHSDIQVQARKAGLDCLTPILWHKIANGATEAEGNGTGTYGKPNQPGMIIKNNVEYVLFMRKGGEYRSPSQMQKVLSMITPEEWQLWVRSIWSDLPGASTRKGHPAPFPVEMAHRLIRMFSFAGDTVLDPFLGTGSTTIAAIECGRNSIGQDIEPKYLELAYKNIEPAAKQRRLVGATRAKLQRDI